MLGTVRFFLAWSVMLSHLPVGHFATSFNPAVSAVIWFYFISGYLMYGSFTQTTFKKESFLQQSLFFYLKRFWRIFPLYLIVLTVTVVAIKILGPSSFIPFFSQELSWQKILLNTILLFNNYVFPPLEIQTLMPHPLVPPSWSLSTEWHFYLLVPFLFFLFQKKKRLFVLLLIGSMLFELWAFSDCKKSDAFGYRYIFGVFWIFGLGFLSAAKVHLWKFMYILFLIYSFTFGFYFFDHHFAQEITIAVALFPLLLQILKTENNSILDRYLGKLSYPIFLLHFFVFFIVEKVIGYERNWLYTAVVFAVVFLLANLLVWFEQKFILPLKKKL